MDAKDVRIYCDIAFRDLSYNAATQRHVSSMEIGRKLGLDEKTVRVRIKRMEDSGFIKYYQAMPSLALLGFRSVSLYRFEAINLTTKNRVLKAVHGTPHTVEAFDYIGPVVAVDIAGETTGDVKGTADGIAARFELTEQNLGERAVRDPHVALDRTDWQLIQTLRYNARSTTKDVAKSLSMTPRMTEYRIRKLLDSGALIIRAVINTQKQEGLIFYELEISVQEPKRMAVVDRLRDKHGEKLLSVSSPDPGLVLASLFGFTLNEPEESVVSALELEGVKYCSLLILKEVIEPMRPNWVDRLIEQKLAP